MGSVSVIENSLFNNSEFSGAQLLADLDGLGTDDVLPRNFDSGVVLNVVGRGRQVNLE
jgi:hypothetical protein